MKDRQVVLIVDDTPENLRLLGDMLEQQGHEVAVATTGEQALEAIRVSPPDLILLDILMPQMDGYEVCRRLKTDPVMKLIPIIFLSVLDLPDHKIRAFREGAVDYITKPFQSEEVVARVETHLKLIQIDELKREVEERKKTEAERELLMAAIEQAAEVIIITDTEGSIQYINPAFEVATGYAKKDVIGKNPRILKSGIQDQAFYHDLWDTISSGKTWHGRMINKRKNGETYTDEATISPVRDVKGNIINYISTRRNITHELELEKQYHQSQRLESIGRLAGGVAHDFNNMLSVVMGYSELALAKNVPDPNTQAALEGILNAAMRSADLTRQLLAFARKQTIIPKILNLNDTIENMLKMLRRLIGEDIELLWKPASNLWRVKIDPSQIDQILVNLIINARDAILKSGMITIETHNFEIDDVYCRTHLDTVPGSYVRLVVSDNGCGMDKETMANIFEPFYTTKEQGKGTGLGLATVYGIVKQNDGFINVYSETGKGSIFNIYFSRAEADAKPATLPKKVPTGNETVLFVEDNPEILKIGSNLLERLGYTVLSANRADEAIRFAERHTGELPLLVTDVVMPEMNGRDLYKKLLQRFPNLKCIYMSGFTVDIISHYDVLDKEVNFIQKPFSMKDLAAIVRNILDGK